MLAALVNDADAVYSVRIDPTFSDANWISMNPGVPGADGKVGAAVVDESGNLYIGGDFTLAGNVLANRIAKWNGSSWAPLGSGMKQQCVCAGRVRQQQCVCGGQLHECGRD